MFRVSLFCTDDVLFYIKMSLLYLKLGQNQWIIHHLQTAQSALTE